MNWILDVIVIAGLGMLGYGLHLVSPPAMWVAIGLCLMAFGLLAQKKKSR